jgi:hypothetical protein
MNSDDLGAPIAQLQQVRDAAAASASPAERAYADILRLRAGTAKAPAAEIEKSAELNPNRGHLQVRPIKSFITSQKAQPPGHRDFRWCQRYIMRRAGAERDPLPVALRTVGLVPRFRHPSGSRFSRDLARREVQGYARVPEPYAGILGYSCCSMGHVGSVRSCPQLKAV